MRTAPIEILGLLEEAATVYAIPRDTDIQRMSETYAKALGHFSLDVLKHAFDKYAQTETRGFPRPGNIYPLAKAIAATPVKTDLGTKYAEWYQSGMWGGCPVCNSVLEGLDSPRRPLVKHDVQRHHEAQVPIVGPR